MSHRVRLVDPDGAQLGIKGREEALDLAHEMGLDLVEVAGNANPPVCRIMDFGKFKYLEAQKAKESRRQSTQTVVKEIKYRPKIGRGDFDTKTRQVEKFLNEGSRVKVSIMFRGREVQHPELGRRILDEVAEEMDSIAKVDLTPRMDGRNMTMLLVPRKKPAKSKSGGESSPAKNSKGAGASPAEQPQVEPSDSNSQDAEPPA